MKNSVRNAIFTEARDRRIGLFLLALALIFLGCKEEARPKTGEDAEKREAVEEAAAAESKGDDDLCGGKELDRENQFCHNGEIYKGCFVDCEGDCASEYDPETEICVNDGVSDAILKRCDMKTYDTPTQFCFESAIYDKCGEEKYNVSTQFCYYSKEDKTYGVYDKCGGKEYAPNGIVSCSDGKITVDYGEIQHNGQTYKTIKIGEQTWMAEDLGNYSWAEAMEACPEDWHLPNSKEWGALFKYVGELARLWGNTYKLMHYGFYCCPDEDGLFPDEGNVYWTADGHITYLVELKDAYPEGKQYKYPVRCLKD